MKTNMFVLGAVLIIAVFGLESCLSHSAGVLTPSQNVGDDPGHGPRIKLRTKLTATLVLPHASGQAKFEQREDRTRFGTEIEDVPSMETFEAFVNGVSMGTFASDSTGVADLNLDDRDGDTVSTMVEGDLVEVFNDQDQLILSGTLEEHN